MPDPRRPITDRPAVSVTRCGWVTLSLPVGRGAPQSMRLTAAGPEQGGGTPLGGPACPSIEVAEPCPISATPGADALLRIQSCLDVPRDELRRVPHIGGDLLSRHTATSAGRDQLHTEPEPCVLERGLCIPRTDPTRLTRRRPHDFHHVFAIFEAPDQLTQKGVIGGEGNSIGLSSFRHAPHCMDESCIRFRLNHRPRPPPPSFGERELRIQGQRTFGAPNTVPGAGRLSTAHERHDCGDCIRSQCRPPRRW